MRYKKMRLNHLMKTNISKFSLLTTNNMSPTTLRIPLTSFIFMTTIQTLPTPTETIINNDQTLPTPTETIINNDQTLPTPTETRINNDQILTTPTETRINHPNTTDSMNIGDPETIITRVAS
jgi:hypothetical protein